jgi:hypothetical protein
MTIRSLLGGALALVGATLGFAVCPEMAAASRADETTTIETRVNGFILMFLSSIDC